MEMTQMLKDKKNLSPERQHQLYGAVVEIKSFLETVKEYENELKDDESGTFLHVDKPSGDSAGYWHTSKENIRSRIEGLLGPLRKKR
jgi:hypothetical protein